MLETNLPVKKIQENNILTDLSSKEWIDVGLAVLVMPPVEVKGKETTETNKQMEISLY